MSYFKLGSNFKVFIKNSHTGFQNQVPELSLPEIVEITVEDEVPKSVKRIINNLDILTKDDKIIWSKDYGGFLNGIVVKECGLSNYKILIDDISLMEFGDYGAEILKDIVPICRINLIKDGLSSKKMEYVINIMPDNDELSCLLETIERKLLQESN